MLFNQTIFGPVHSRRLGISLGINLLPVDAKICSYNCIYCECGFNTPMHEAPVPTREEVRTALESRLQQMSGNGEHLDVITFAGNGEPTLHAEFAGIIDDTIALRNRYYPTAKISVLSNATRIDRPHVFEALLKVDNNILKFDSAIDHTYRLMNRPTGGDRSLTVAWLTEHLKRFNGALIVQTMFTRGAFEGEAFDNTTQQEVDAWLDALDAIRPRQVMIYTIDRETPVKQLVRIPLDELESIAAQARARGFEVSVAG